MASSATPEKTPGPARWLAWRGGGPLLAGALTVVLYCVQAAWRGEFPFGPLSNQINDLGGQIVPFVAEYRRILTGTSGLSNLEWTWTLGMGTPFLGTFATYLSNPLFLIAVVFGQNQIELAVTVATIAALGLAAASMAVLLRVLVPNQKLWWQVLLGTSYGLSGWAINDANYFPAWLWGFIMFPWLIVVARWTIQRRRFLPGVAIIALAWWGNYYSAYMASIGAGLVLATMLVAERVGWRHGLASLFRFLLQGILGVGITALILLPTITQVGQATPQEGSTAAGVGFAREVSHLLPMTEAVALAPSFYVGSVALFLACALLAQSARNWRFRLAWAACLAVTLTSMGTAWGLWLWNGFDNPNGSLWRSAFVFAGMLIVCAAYTVEDLTAVRWWGWLTAAILVAGLCVVTATQPWTAALHPAGFAFVAGTAVLVVLHAALRGDVLRRVAAVMLCVLIMTELVVSAGFTLGQRNGRLPPGQMRTATDSVALSTRSEILQASGWPTHRTDPVNGGLDVNRGAYLGLPSVSYYGSLIPLVITDALDDRLGASMKRVPRAMYYSPDPAIDALLAVGLRVDGDERTAVASYPLVRALPADRLALLTRPADTLAAQNVFTSRNALFDVPVYSVPPQTVVVNGQLITSHGDPLTLARRATVTVHAECASGALPSLDARQVTGEATVGPGGKTVALERVITGPVKNSSALSITMHLTAASVLPRTPVACLDIDALSNALTTTPAPTIQLGPLTTIRATFPQPVDGVAVLAFAPVTGWTCTADGHQALMQALSGLAAVPMNGARNLTCTYQTPRLAAGAAISLASLALALGLGWLAARRRRRATQRRVA